MIEACSLLVEIYAESLPGAKGPPQFTFPCAWTGVNISPSWRGKYLRTYSIVVESSNASKLLAFELWSSIDTGGQAEQHNRECQMHIC